MSRLNSSLPTILFFVVLLVMIVAGSVLWTVYRMTDEKGNNRGPMKTESSEGT